MALVFNGTSNSAVHGIVTTVNTAEWSIACTFKTGSTVSGVVQYPFHINRASSFLRGWGIEISTAGAIRLFRSTGTLAYSSSLGTAAANTIYRCVITKNSSGVATAYINSISTTATQSGGNITDIMSRIITGALYSNAYSNWFDGKVARIAKYDSVLSTPDITLLLADGNTPADTTATPSDYWIAVSDDTATIGSNATVRTGATYDSDELGTFVTVAVNSVNGGTNSVQIGSSGNTAETLGLTTATSASIGGVAMTSVAGSSSPWTFTCPPLTDGAVSPYPIGTFTITGAGGSPTLAGVAVTLPAGLTAQTLAGTLNTTDTGVLHDFSPAAVVTDKIFYPPVPAVGKYITIDAQGNIDTDYEGTTQFWHWQASTGITRSYDVIVGAGGSSSNITSAGLTSIGLTRVGLTSSGL